jgi:hypothetical protein
MIESGRQLAAARDQVRDSLAVLESDPSLRAPRLLGLVHVVESGVLLAYDRDRDDFEALL